MLKTLDEIFIEESCDKSSLYHNYAPYYEEAMKRSRAQPICMLEMGIQFGQSMKSWLRYFTNMQAHFYGMDIAQEFKTEDPRYHFHLCDQSIAEKIGFVPDSFDFIIDDAGHFASAQAAAFHTLWPTLKSCGAYFIEDTFTLFHPFWKSPMPTGDWLHTLFSALNKGGKQFHGRPGGNLSDGALNYFEKTIDSIHAKPGLIILFKK